MIEKLDIKNGGVEDLLNCIKKINEVIDVVNALIKENNIHEMQKQDDPYAEQRKWIGKLCRFWDKKEEEKVFGILTTIDSDCGLSDMCPYWNDTTKNWFEHCEPVKDDIIYKGE